MQTRHLALAALGLAATITLADCGSGGDWTTVTDQGCVDATVEKLNSMLDAGQEQKAAASMTGHAACSLSGKQFAGKYRCDGKKLQATCK
jgi:hypothetical protein